MAKKDEVEEELEALRKLEKDQENELQSIKKKIEDALVELAQPEQPEPIVSEIRREDLSEIIEATEIQKPEEKLIDEAKPLYARTEEQAYKTMEDSYDPGYEPSVQDTYHGTAHTATEETLSHLETSQSLIDKIKQYKG